MIYCYFVKKDFIAKIAGIHQLKLYNRCLLYLKKKKKSFVHSRVMQCCFLGYFVTNYIEILYDVNYNKF